MDEELRERLCQLVYDKDHWYCEVTTDEIVGALVSEIEAAGYSLVKTDRLERLKYAAANPEPARGTITGHNWLQDGDLD